MTRPKPNAGAWAIANQRAMDMKRKQKRKPVRNPKPVRGSAPVINRRVNNEPLKPARATSYQRTSENAQESPGDELQRGPLDSLLDEAGPDDVSEVDA